MFFKSSNILTIPIRDATGNYYLTDRIHDYQYQNTLEWRQIRKVLNRKTSPSIPSDMQT